MKELSGDALEKLAKLELENFCKETDILDWNEVQKYFQITNSEVEYNRRQWWPLLNLAMWWSFYIKNVND